MKFDDLYNKVFINERDEDLDVADPTEVASPENFDDVEPLPLPELDTTETEETSDLEADAPTTGEGDSTLKDYVFKLEEFADVLNSPEGESLASLVSKLDKPETPFDGISSRTSTDIIAAAKTVREVVETLKNFLIHSMK